MRCLIIGHGSIGIRHAKILEQLGCQISFVTSQKIENNPSYFSIKEALQKECIDYVVIANSTHLHFDALLQLIENDYQGIVLVEKPLFLQIKQLPKNKIKKILVAYNLRFHELLIQLKKIIQNEKIITFSAYVGQYLPTWRKGRDYRDCYSSKKEQGGGVLRDLSHELDYSLWLCGPCQYVTAIGGRYSQLEINSDDVYSIVMQCVSCPIVNLQVNYLDRSIRREIVVNTQNNTIFVDLMKGVLSVDGEIHTQITEGMPQTYIRQHQAVMENNFMNFCSYSEGLSVVTLIEIIEKASESKMWINV